MNLLKRELVGSRGIFALVLTLAATLFGCDHSRSTPNETAENTLTTISYNYTGSEIRQVLFSDANTKFDVRNAAPGGSPFSRFGSSELADNGGQVWVGARACCFVWNPTEKEIKIKVVWHIVFEPDTYDEFVKLNDERDSRDSPPGSVWCQTIVEVQKPYPLHPEALFLHFLPDGVVFAKLSEAGSLRSSHALPSPLVKSHNRLANGARCPAVVDNPWYKIRREPHRE